VQRQPPCGPFPFGIKLDPFTPGDISYLLWLIMGYLLV